MIKQNLKNYRNMLPLNKNLNYNVSWEHWKIITVWMMENMKKIIQVVLLLLKFMGHLKCIKFLTLTLFLTFFLLFLPLVLTITIFPNIFVKTFLLDTFTFVEELKEVSINDKFFLSYDVNSLFTRIPLKETIKKPVDLINISYPIFKNIKW